MIHHCKSFAESFADRTLVWERYRKLSATRIKHVWGFPNNHIKESKNAKTEKLKRPVFPTELRTCLLFLCTYTPRLFPRKTYTCFGGILSEYYKLSNFFKCNIKYLGKTFNDTKDQLIKKLIKCEFMQNVDLDEKVRNIGTVMLDEANSYDTYWGAGISIVSKNTMTQNQWGQNKLGKLLMKLRSTLSE